MKKSFVLLVALVILVSGTAYYAQSALLQEKDKVHYEENVIYGDKSVVDGVTVEMNSRYDYNLCWNTRYEIGAKAKEETEYSFYPWGNYEGNYENSGHIDFSIDCTDTMSNDYNSEMEYYGLDAAMKELYDKTALGTENSTTVYLKDYVDYYTFGLVVQLPYKTGEEYGTYSEYSYFYEKDLRLELEASWRTEEEIKNLKAYLADMEAFQEFFKIPVLDTEVYSLAIAKDESGNVIGMADSYMHGGSGTGEIDIPDAPNVPGADAFSFRVFSAFDDGDCYMTFDPHTSNDNLVDISQIPGGYGIYHFTYDEKKGTLNLDELKMVYALAVNTQWDSMVMDDSGENILLFTYDNFDDGNYYLSVIDRETMTLVDTFLLGDTEYGLSYWIYEDYLVVSNENLMVFPMDENGRYFQAWAVNKEKINTMAKAEETEYQNDILGWNSQFDWDGKKLLIANSVIYEDEGFVVQRCKCDFFVAAVDETGLLYYAEYYSSLATSDVNYNPCQLHDIGEVPITVRWK